MVVRVHPVELTYRELAQLVERRSPKPKVGCSNHSFPANKLFHGRQVVCHGTVNALDFGGSNPSRGANYASAVTLESHAGL